MDQFISSDELNTYVLDEENGLHKVVNIDENRMEVIYRPTDMWVHQEVGDGETDTTEINRLRKKYDQYYYFILSMSRNEKEALHQVEGGFGQYSELVQTMSFRMQDYVTLTTVTQDTIPVGDAMLNRTYGMSSSTDILFVFNKAKAIDKEWVQFNLNEFGLGVGNQRFRFRVKDLESAPRIYR